MSINSSFYKYYKDKITKNDNKASVNHSCDILEVSLLSKNYRTEVFIYAKTHFTFLQLQLGLLSKFIRNLISRTEF